MTLRLELAHRIWSASKWPIEKNVLDAANPNWLYL
jgi:hypothetical protein